MNYTRNPSICFCPHNVSWCLQHPSAGPQPPQFVAPAKQTFFFALLSKDIPEKHGHGAVVTNSQRHDMQTRAPGNSNNGWIIAFRVHPFVFGEDTQKPVQMFSCYPLNKVIKNGLLLELLQIHVVTSMYFKSKWREYVYFLVLFLFDSQNVFHIK